MNENNNGWSEWSIYVLKELERLNDEVKTVGKKCDTLINQVTVLKVKSAIYGMLSGTVATTIITLLIKYVFKGIM